MVYGARYRSQVTRLSMEGSEAQRARISTARGVNPPSAQSEGVEYYNRHHNAHHFEGGESHNSSVNDENNINNNSDENNVDNNNNIQQVDVVSEEVIPAPNGDGNENADNENLNSDNIADVLVENTPEDVPVERDANICIVCDCNITNRNKFNMGCIRLHSCTVKMCNKCASISAFSSWTREVNPITIGTVACPCCRHITNIPATYVIPRLEPRHHLVLHYVITPPVWATLNRRSRNLIKDAFANRDEIDTNQEIYRTYSRNYDSRPRNRERRNADGRNPRVGVVDSVPPAAPINIGNARNVSQQNLDEDAPVVIEQVPAVPLQGVEQQQRAGGGPVLQRDGNVGPQDRQAIADQPRQLPRPREVIASNPTPLPMMQIGPRGDDEVDMSAVEPATLYTQHNWFSAICGNKSQYLFLALICWFYIANYNGETWGEVIEFIYVGAADKAEGLIGGEIGRRVHNTIIAAIVWFHFVVAAWVYNVSRHKERGYVGALQFPSRFTYGTPTEVNLIGVRLQLFENPNPLKYSGVNVGSISGVGSRAGPQIYGNAARAIYSTIRAGSVAHDNLARFINADLSRLVGPDADPIKLACTALYLEQWIEVGNDVFRTGGDRIPNMRY